MSTPHLGSPQHSSKPRKNQKGEKASMAPQGKFEILSQFPLHKSLRVAQLLPCVARCALLTTLFVAGSPLLALQFGILWVSCGPRAVTLLWPQGWGLLQGRLSSEALLGRPLQGRSSGAGARTRGMPNCGSSPPARLCPCDHEAELVFLF